MYKVDPRIVKALRVLSDRMADDSRNTALAGGLSSDTCYSVQKSRDNNWECIEKILNDLEQKNKDI